MQQTADAGKETSKLLLSRVDDPGLAETQTPPFTRMQRAMMRRLAQLLSVVLPTVIAGSYFMLLASPRYESEAKFIVRSTNDAIASQLSGLIQTSSSMRSSDDAYVVHAYMQSRDAIAALLKDVNLLEKIGHAGVDVGWRFPGPILPYTFERLYRYMQSLIFVEFDQSTGVSTLRVQAFRPEDARDIAERLLANSETLINRLGQRAQRDAIESANKQVEESRAEAEQTLTRITEFRNRETLIDPVRDSIARLETISKLAQEQAFVAAQITELERSAANSPQVNTLRLRSQAIDKQIVVERERLAGAGPTLAPLIAEYERLILMREFAERRFASALASLEAARLEAQRQRLFLERITSPLAPDDSRYPKRLLNVLFVMAFSIMIYSSLRWVLADSLAHSGK